MRLGRRIKTAALATCTAPLVNFLRPEALAARLVTAVRGFMAMALDTDAQQWECLLAARTPGAQQVERAVDEM